MVASLESMVRGVEEGNHVGGGAGGGECRVVPGWKSANAFGLVVNRCSGQSSVDEWF